MKVFDTRLEQYIIEWVRIYRGMTILSIEPYSFVSKFSDVVGQVFFPTDPKVVYFGDVEFFSEASTAGTTVFCTLTYADKNAVVNKVFANKSQPIPYSRTLFDKFFDSFSIGLAGAAGVGDNMEFSFNGYKIQYN